MNLNEEYLKELKEETTEAPMIENNPQYRIKVLHRGEQLFYKDNLTNKALIIEIQVRNGSIFEDSISKWDTREKITDSEKKVILDRVVGYFENYQMLKATVR